MVLSRFLVFRDRDVDQLSQRTEWETSGHSVVSWMFRFGVSSVTKVAWNLQISTTFTRDSLPLPGVQINSFSIGL